MVRIFFWVSCGVSLLLFIGAFWLKRFKDNIVRRLIQMLFGIAAVTVLLNAVGTVVQNATAAALLLGIYLALTDYLAVGMLTFVQKYTEQFEENRIVKLLVYIGCVVDTVSMLINTWTGHMFAVERTAAPGGGTYNVMVHNVPLFNVHLAFVYLIILLSLLSLCVKTFQTVKIYRAKYESVLLSLIFVMVVDVAYVTLDIVEIDISPLTYAILAAAVAYFVLAYIPQGLMVKLLSYSIQDVDMGILCFDMNGQSVYANGWVSSLPEMRDVSENVESFYTKWGNKKENIEKMASSSWQLSREIDHECRYLNIQYNPLLDERGHYIGCYFVMKDETASVNRLKQEHYIATHDELTGIYNQKCFYESVKKLLDTEPDVKRCIVVSNIKDFKLVNELFGKKRGDEILIAIANMLKENVHDDSIYGRLGSDTFAVCLRDELYSDENFIGFAHAAEDLAQTDVYRMHIHMGVYHITDLSIDVPVMCDRALMAIHKIKENYSETLACYDEEIWSKLHQQSIILSEFDTAISEKQFQMYLQPQISSADLSLLGAEALVRWKHPERGMMPPGVFIDVLEKAGLIYKLDAYIWEAACIQLRKWQDEGWEKLHISVNISPKDFYYIDIYKTFVELVEKYQIPPINLKLEITETAIMADLKNTLAVMTKLRDYGFQIEIDDFGSGYSSLNTLKDMNVNVLKLDMGFLRETQQSEKNRVIMNSIITMAKQLQLLTVAEGVETSEQVTYLTGAGCDIFQGYYFSKPISVSEFEEKYMGA